MNKTFKYAFADALGTVVYIVLVASFIFFVGQRFPDDNASVLMPVAFLTLLVFSVALVGTLLFGRPVMWYIDGKKKDALSLLGYTLGVLFVALVVVLAVVFIYFA